MRKLNLVFKLSLLQFLFIASPLYFLDFKQEAIVSAALIVLYLTIDANLNALIKVAKLLKWSRISIIITGFFGIKNIFFVLCLILFWKVNLLHAGVGVVFIILFNYALYSFALARKLLSLPQEEELKH
jgi:hypothetical protein